MLSFILLVKMPTSQGATQWIVHPQLLATGRAAYTEGEHYVCQKQAIGYRYMAIPCPALDLTDWLEKLEDNAGGYARLLRDK